MSTPLSHAEAMDCICGAAGVTVLSYEEAINAYVRLRALDATPAKPPQGDVGADSGLAAADDNHKALVEAVRKAIEEIASLSVLDARRTLDQALAPFTKETDHGED